ncbi:Bax inhibitor-1/YccA family protein [Breoghania sp.]|uniref:Bax inhibitor-1/YccA family protein n=1 Tax=Breoghania sp. TaxID=2065378 RepID=UPI00262594C5|nr:Bax inhibitor-1/YccA family protein [Breoghania sp.]MDJ0932609.1 Bax inhibitor-1/YccA family protein [Breoghania sp.]
MATFDRNQATRYAGSLAETDLYDAGLRAYMLRVYNYMALGMGITGLAALGIFMMSVTDNPANAVAQLNNGMMLTNFGVALFASPLKWLVILAPLAMVFFLSFRIQKMSVGAAQSTFWIYAALVGISFSSILLVYTHESVARVFFITAASFESLSLFGYTTQKDLFGWGSFLFMGLIGIVIASLVNIFIGFSALQFAVSVIGVLVFAGLAAYDTQQIKEMYSSGDSDVVAGRKAVMGALRLYLDFINLFIMLLQLFGNRE